MFGNDLAGTGRLSKVFVAGSDEWHLFRSGTNSRCGGKETQRTDTPMPTADWEGKQQTGRENTRKTKGIG